MYTEDDTCPMFADKETYEPGVVVTRDQMAVYIQRAFELPV